ncbi:MAG: prepilin-type N-terminal cleavage/methylation domain-containing protein [Lentisphaeria bacterium]
MHITSANTFNISGCAKSACVSNKKVKSSRRGFTLIEVMVAFMLTGAMIAAAVGILKSSLWAANYYSHRLAAANIANSRIERLRSIPYAELEAMEEDATPVNSKGIADSEGDFVRTTVIGTDYMNTRTVTVTVGGLWKHDRPRVSVSVSSIISSASIMR